MKLPSSLTTVTKISKLVAVAFFVILPFIGFYLGTRYQKINNSIDEASKVLNKSSVIDSLCIKPHLLDEHTWYQNSKKWYSYAQLVENTVYYVEASLTDKVSCPFLIYQDKNSELSNLQLYGSYGSSLSNKVSFISGERGKVSNLYIVDLSSREKVAIPLDSASQYSVVYGWGDYIDGKYTGPLIVVIPVTLIAGCEGQEGCSEGLAIAVKNDWSRKDINVTIININGKYVKIPRNELPVDIGDASITVEDESIVFMKPNTTVITKIGLDRLK